MDVYARARMKCTCLMVTLLPTLLLELPIVFCSDSTTHPTDLTFAIPWNDDPKIECEIGLGDFLTNEEYSSFALVLPFPTYEVLYCPDNVAFAWQNRERMFTLAFIIIPPHHPKVTIKLRSMPIISSFQGGKKFSIKFDYEDVPPEIEWLIAQGEVIISFDEIKVDFPLTIGMATIDDNPPPTRTEGFARIYSYNDVIETGGTLTIRYPGRMQNIWIVVSESIFVVPAGFYTAFRIATTEEEKVRERRKICLLGIIIVWIATGLLIYIWIIATPLLSALSPILPLVIACLVNAIAMVAWAAKLLHA